MVSVRAKGVSLDEEAVTFGIRDARFESETGFWLNGKNFKLLGACLHQDGGAFGSAVPVAVWEQRLTALREIGVNAIRTAHNPPDPGFLDLCDRMGFLVMDELFDCWTVGKPGLDGQALKDYHLYFNEWSKTDARDTVRRDRNHPSVILWSSGNEIHDTPQEEKAKQILAGLVAVFHENDPTRPVTQALFRPNVSHDYTNGLADLLDVIGTNYRDTELLAAWRAKPGRKIIGTEQQHDRRTWLTLRDNAAEAGRFLRRRSCRSHGRDQAHGPRAAELVECKADGRPRAPRRAHAIRPRRSRLRAAQPPPSTVRRLVARQPGAP
jgi:beta-galactosidase